MAVAAFSGRCASGEIDDQPGPNTTLKTLRDNNEFVSFQAFPPQRRAWEQLGTADIACPASLSSTPFRPEYSLPLRPIPLESPLLAFVSLMLRVRPLRFFYISIYPSIGFRSRDT